MWILSQWLFVQTAQSLRDHILAFLWVPVTEDTVTILRSKRGLPVCRYCWVLFKKFRYLYQYLDFNSGPRTIFFSKPNFIKSILTKTKRHHGTNLWFLSCLTQFLTLFTATWSCLYNLTSPHLLLFNLFADDQIFKSWRTFMYFNRIMWTENILFPHLEK